MFYLPNLPLFHIRSSTASISLLSACGGDDGPAAANPTGYYTGTAEVFDGTDQAVDIQDLQGLVENNRFMAMSEARELLYDGTITSISGNNFSATVKVYKDGALVTGSPTSFSGQIQQGVQITGTFSGTGDWRGAFTLNYSDTNDVDSDLDIVKTTVNVDYWGGGNTDPQFRLDATTGNVSPFDVIADGVMAGCEFAAGTIVPVANTQLYRFTVDVDVCIGANSPVEGIYTGLATTKDDGDTLVMAISKSDATNGSFAHASDYVRRLVP